MGRLHRDGVRGCRESGDRRGDRAHAALECRGRRCRGARRDGRVPRMASHAARRADPIPLQAQEPARRAHRRARATDHGREREDVRRSESGDPSRDRERRSRVRHPAHDAGLYPRGRDAGCGRDADPAATGRRGRDHAIQLSGDDPVLVPAVRDRLWQHPRAQAVGTGAAHDATRGGAARDDGIARWRRQSRQRRTHSRRCVD